MTYATSNISQPEPIVATPLQQGMIFHNLRQPGSGIDIEQILVRSVDRIDRVRMADAFAAMLGANEVLRTYFDWEVGDQPQLFVATDCSLEISEQVASDDSDLDAMLRSHMQAERRQGFELDKAPLMRARLFHIDTGSVLVWTFHHVLLDGRSFAPLLEELFLRYENADVLPPCGPSFTDYARWLAEQEFSGSLDFWGDYLAGVNSPSAFPTLASGKSEVSFGYVEKRLSRTDTASIEASCARVGVSVNSMLQAAWAVLLHQYSDAEDVIFGATYTTRHCDFPGAQNVVGLMINTLPVRVNFSSQPSGIELLKKLSAHAKDVRPHVLTPLNLVQQEAGLSGDVPLFDTAVIFDRLDVDAALRQRQPDWDHLQCEYAGQTNFSVALVAYGGENLTLRLEFDHGRIDDEHGRVIHEAFCNLLRQFAGDATISLSRMSLLSEQQRRQRLTPVLSESGSCESLHQTFRRVARTWPDRVALRCGDQSMTYEELDLESDQVREALIRVGVRPGDMVALCMDRSNTLIAGLLGILKSGAAYVPIDPAYPDSRIEFILDDAGIRVILSDVDTADRLLKFDRQILLADDIPEQSESGLPGERDNLVTGQDLAYVIYTSGSTGTPKGVLVTHRNVSRLMSSTQHWFEFGPEDKWTLFHSIAFDWTVFEIWGALSYGGELTVVPYWVSRSPADFYRLLSESSTTVLCQTPSAFLSLQGADDEMHEQYPNCLRYVIFGGEALELSSLKPWVERHGDDKPALINMYGITETTVHVTYRRIRASDIESGSGSVIGEPIGDLDVLLLNRHAEPVPAGVVAEIFVAGAGVARGYLNRPELTKERFCENLSEDLAGTRLYRSGDLARWLPNGDLVYAGRSDFQVKIRGFRIELGEIESIITAIDGVQQAVVIAAEGPGGSNRLIAYYVSASVRPEDVSRIVADSLPAHMVPAQVLPLSSLPLTQNGKVDRKALPDPDFLGSSTTFREPGPGTETELARICKEVLGIEDIGADDNFFERGGDSILSIQLISRARKIGLNLTARDVYRNPTIATMAGVSASHAHQASADALEASGTEIPLLPVQQWFFDTVGDVDHWNQAFSFKVRRPVSKDDLKRALETIVERHPVLGSVFQSGESGWSQHYGKGVELLVEECEAAEIADTTAGQRENFTLHLNRKVRLAGSRLVCGGLLNFADGTQEVCLAIHHLVTDGITWNVIVHELDDMLTSGTADGGGKGRKPAAEHRFAEWSRFLAGNAANFATEKGYWESRIAGRKSPAGEKPFFSHNASFHRMHAAKTWPVQSDVPRQDVILAAFAGALSSVAGQESVGFDLESHGRDHELTSLELFDAAGWFTTIFPFLVSTPDSANLLELLESVHRELRALPSSGIGYGVLTAAGECGPAGAAQHLFNYMGNFSGMFSDCEQLRWCNPIYTTWRHGSARHSHPCEWIVAVDDRGIHIDALFDDRKIDPNRVATIAGEILQRIDATNGLIQDMNLSQDKLLVSASDWTQAMTAVESADRILPVAPIQELYLYGSRGGLDIGVEQWYLKFDGAIDVAAMRQSWQETLGNHSGLCTTFPTNRQGRNLQAFHAQPNFQWNEFEIDGDDGLAGVQQKELTQGLDVSNGPLHRLAWVKAGSQSHYLVWTHHHVHIDGWSWPLVLREVHGRYRAALQDEQAAQEYRASDYAAYIDWVSRSRPKLDAGFWRSYLESLGDEGRLPNEQTGLVGTVTHTDELDRQLSGAIGRIAIKEGVTPSSIFHAAWVYALTELLGRREICVGSTFSGRPAGAIDFTEVIGPFVTNLPVRVRFGKNSLLGLTKSIHDTILQLQERQYHSPAEIQEASGLPWTTPMYESLLVFQNYGIGDRTFDVGEDAIVSEVFAPVRTNFPVTIVVNPGEEIRIDYIVDSARISSAFVSDASQLVRNFLVAVTDGRQSIENGSYDYSKWVGRDLQFSPKGELPRDETEERLVEIWRSLFGDSRVGVTDNFFDLGGRSIMVPVLMSRIEAATGTTVPFAALYRDPTVQGLARHLQGESGTGAGIARRSRARADRSRDAIQKAANRRSRRGRPND